MKTLADRIISFNKNVRFDGKLPLGIRVMNPFVESPEILPISSAFYRKYYNDNDKRHLILGINPGRFGAGVTGIPFTDTKRLKNECGLTYSGPETHEPSSVFIYEMIEGYGGPAQFYKDFYIHSVCPLGLTVNKNGKEVNCNYYDFPELTAALHDLIVENIRKQMKMGVYTDVCFCFGTGKNEKFLKTLNEQHGFFEKIIALEHPRFIIQYKSRSMQLYIDKYLEAFHSVKQVL